MQLPPELDPRQVSPDPETMRFHSQLEAALVAAATTGGSIELAFGIAEEMRSRGLLTTTIAQALALTLYLLSSRHLESTPDAPDPYGVLARRLVTMGRLTQEDIEVATYGTILNAGLINGWLMAPLYDELSRYGGPDPAFQGLLAGIERRETETPS